MKLCDMPNIGQKLESRLIAAGIKNPQELVKLGSKEAFIRLRLIEGDTCNNVLYALEGAIQGIRWHYLSQKDKEDLKNFYHSTCHSDKK